MLKDRTTQEKLIAGLFLCSAEPNEILQELEPGWNAQAGSGADQKLAILGDPGGLGNVFPWKDELSEQIDHLQLCRSFFTQPDLFLRVRPGKEKIVKQKLTNAGIPFESISETCIALSNSSKIDTVIELDKEAVVQDMNSQKVGELLQLLPPSSSALRVWDCCAASGGKSIMAKDILGDIELFVSDVRESILINLEDRFERAGLDNYERFVADLGKPVNVFLPSFNLVIADVPCTGSGTWGRTPEQLYYFEPGKIAMYADLQKRITETAIKQVEPGGYLLYITCSVFKKENEEQVDLILANSPFQVVKMGLFTGVDQKADNLFAALLSLPE